MEAKLKRIPTGRPDLISFELPADYKQEYAYLVKKAETTNDYWRVSLEPWRNKRSTGDHSQNHRLNGFIHQYCDYTGYLFEDVKLFVKRNAMALGLPAALDKNGNIVYSITDGNVMPKSEKDMNTQECGWCIQVIELMAAELGITLHEGYE
jgi:hypothetical protein